MPEGDTIFRAARTLHRALGGRTVTRFDSVFPQLTRVDHDTPLAGRRIERVESRGKHVLIWFSGDLALRTHMRMNGSWHIYRPGERWQRPGHDMRIVIETAEMHAVGFTIPVAEFLTVEDAARNEPLQSLGPDLLSPTFDPAEALRRLHERADMEIADALLDQRALAGIGNVFKSEVLYVGKVNPFTRVRDVGEERLARLVDVARRLLTANVRETSGHGRTTRPGLRSESPQARSADKVWVYGRGGKPCRRCGTAISYRKQGADARGTYWCPRCAPLAPTQAG